MRIVFAAILWGIGGAIFGAVNGAAISWAVDQSLLQIGLSMAVLAGIIGAIYGAFLSPRKALPVETVSGKARFNLESCAWCKGSGIEVKIKKRKKIEMPCQVCRGRGRVLVEQPPHRCPKCKGKGKVSMGRKCKVCDGSGWDTYAYLNQ